MSGTPIYRQIAVQAAQLIAGGHLGPGERLPSVRAVVREQGVNALSVMKAYAVLERDGLVVRRRGQGMVVSCGTLDAAGVVETRIRGLVEAAGRLGMTRAGVVEAVDAAWRTRPEPDVGTT